MQKGEFEAFVLRDEFLTFILNKHPKELFFVKDRDLDELGYPNLEALPELYVFLWNNYR